MQMTEATNLIHQLTIDNDERQELWVHYFETNNLLALEVHLAEIRKDYSEEQLLQITLWRRVHKLSDLNLLQLFDHFTDLEQSIMRLLALGASLQEISSIKGIGAARTRHIISVICENDAWSKSWR